MMLLSPLEVLDKVPGPLRLWVLGIILGGAGYLLGQRRAWLGMIPITLMFLLALLLRTTSVDPGIEAALRAEPPNFTLTTYLPIVLGILASVAGIARGRRSGARAA